MVPELSHKKALDDFDIFYKEYLNETVKKLERKRSKISKKITSLFWVIAILAIAIFISGILFFSRNVNLNIEPDAYLALFFTILIFSLSWVKNKYWNPLKKEIKKTVPEKIFNFIDPNSEYKHSSCIGKNKIEESGLFEKLSSYKGSDYARFDFNGRKCEFSEVTFFWKRGKRKVWSTGVFVVAEIDREIEKPVWVWSRGERGQVLRDFKGEIVDLESPTFEKLFDVRGDQFESRRIFTPLFMHEVISLRINKNEAVYLSYIGNRIYIYLHNKKQIIDVNLFKNFNKEAIRGMYNEINDILSTLTTLNVKKEKFDPSEPRELQSFSQDVIDEVTQRAVNGERLIDLDMFRKILYLTVMSITILFVLVYFLNIFIKF